MMHRSFLDSNILVYFVDQSMVLGIHVLSGQLSGGKKKKKNPLHSLDLCTLVYSSRIILLKVGVSFFWHMALEDVLWNCELTRRAPWGPTGLPRPSQAHAAPGPGSSTAHTRVGRLSCPLSSIWSFLPSAPSLQDGSVSESLDQRSQRLSKQPSVPSFVLAGFNTLSLFSLGPGMVQLQHTALCLKDSTHPAHILNQNNPPEIVLPWTC